MIGKTLAHYTISSQIGKGSMGLQVPEMRKRPSLCADHCKALAVHSLSASSITDIRDDSSQCKNTAYLLVLGSVPYDDR
jgi:hypothetical protein